MGPKLHSIFVASFAAIWLAIGPWQAWAVTLVSSSFDTDAEGWTFSKTGRT
jgi:hypothetical protein